MSCDASFCSELRSKRRSNSGSGSGSGSKIGKFENPDSSSGSQKGGISIENFIRFYMFVKLLGIGAFGVVNLMQHRHSGKSYAVKVIKKTKPNTDMNTRNEIELGMILDSQYVCKVYSFYEDNNHFYIIMEYLEGMDLFDFIKKNPQFFINNPKIFWVVVKSILRGLAYLHSQGIAHMDIKPDNVFLLLDNQGNIFDVKLVDLGLSIDVNNKPKCFQGTGAYMGPEFFHLCWDTGLPADIWSLGMTMFAMIMGFVPFSSKLKDPERAQQKIFRKIEFLLSEKGFFNPFLKLSNDPSIRDMQSIILSCFAICPDKRPTVLQLLDYILSTGSSKAQNNP